MQYLKNLSKYVWTFLKSAIAKKYSRSKNSDRNSIRGQLSLIPKPKISPLSNTFFQNSMSMEDVTARISRVENKCLAVCQQHDTVGGVSMPRGREQPRRRQAAGKVKTTTGGDDQIVFRRND